MKKLIISCILGFVGASATCHADEIAVLPGTGGSTNHAWNGSGSSTIGYQFTVNSPVTVTELGFYVPQGSLADNHQVGIWTSGGTLLVSATVPAATSPTLLDGFDFVPVTPITLGTGQYVIGAEGNSTSLDQFTFGKTASTTISSITLGGALAGEFGPPDTITFPGTPVNFATQGYFGPDFLVAVPEPSTIGLACLGALGLALRLRRSGLKVFWAFGLGKPISALAILLSVGGMCRGSSIAFSYSGGANTTIGGGNTYGFQFTPLVNIIVDSLGYIDVGQNGLAAGHQAGIWDSSGTLLTSATLTTGTLEGPVLDGAQFTYTAITPITLFAGNTYTIGAEEDSADPIFYDFSAIQTSAAPSLLTVSSVGYYVVNQGFAEPTSTIGNHYDIVNFTASAVPEPSSLALAGLGALALASRLRRSGRL